MGNSLTSQRRVIGSAIIILMIKTPLPIDGLKTTAIPRLLQKKELPQVPQLNEMTGASKGIRTPVTAFIIQLKKELRKVP